MTLYDDPSILWDSPLTLYDGGETPSPSTGGGEVESRRRPRKPSKKGKVVPSVKQDDAEAIALAWLMLGDR